MSPISGISSDSRPTSRAFERMRRIVERSTSVPSAAPAPLVMTSITELNRSRSKSCVVSIAALSSSPRSNTRVADGSSSPARVSGKRKPSGTNEQNVGDDVEPVAARQHVDVLRHREAKGRERDDADHAKEIEQQDQTESGPRRRGGDVRSDGQSSVWSALSRSEMLSCTCLDDNVQVSRQPLEPTPCLMSMDIFLQDLRYAARKLLRAPASPSSPSRRSRWRSAPRRPSTASSTASSSSRCRSERRSSSFASSRQTETGKSFPLSPADYLDYTNQTTSFSGLAQFGVGSANFSSTSGGEPSRLDRANVGPAFFDVLGVRPVLGRFFAPGEGAPGSANVVVISDKLWRNSLRGERATSSAHRSRSTSVRTPSSAWRRAR